MLMLVRELMQGSKQNLVHAQAETMCNKPTCIPLGRA